MVEFSAVTLQSDRRDAGPALWASGEQCPHHFAAHIRQPVVAAFKAVGELRVINAQAVQHRRVEVMHVDRVLRDVLAKVVSRAIDQPRLDPATRHPKRETARMMVAPKSSFLISPWE